MSVSALLLQSFKPVAAGFVMAYDARQAGYGGVVVHAVVQKQYDALPVRPRAHGVFKQLVRRRVRQYGIVCRGVPGADGQPRLAHGAPQRFRLAVLSAGEAVQLSLVSGQGGAYRLAAGGNIAQQRLRRGVYLSIDVRIGVDADGVAAALPACRTLRRGSGTAFPRIRAGRRVSPCGRRQYRAAAPAARRISLDRRANRCGCRRRGRRRPCAARYLRAR